MALILAASAALFGSLALAVSAQTPGTTPLPPDYGLEQTAKAAGLPTGQPSPVAVASTIINALLSLVAVITVAIILYGGFTWLTAAGNEEKITKAKSLLGNAVVGLIIIFAAYAITRFIVTNLKSAAGGGPSNTPQFTAGSRNQGDSCYNDADCKSQTPPLICRGAALSGGGQCQP